MNALFPVIGSGGNSFCGPGALSAVSGRSTKAAAEAIRAVTGKTKVFGVDPDDLVAAAGTLGINLEEIAEVPDANDGLFGPYHGSLEKLTKTLDHGTYVVNVTHHYVALAWNGSGWEACDNQSVFPYPIEKFKRRGKRVKRIFKVER